MRGNSRPSETSRMTFSDKAKTFSQYRLSLLRTGFFLPVRQTSPLPLRELFHQRLQFLVILNGPTHPLFPLFGNVELTRLTVMALDQIKGDMRLSTRAAAALLATRLVSHREGPSQQPAAMRQLGGPRTAPAFGRSKSGSGRAGCHLVYSQYTRTGPLSRKKSECEFAPKMD